MSAENGSKKRSTDLARVVDTSIEPSNDHATWLRTSLAARALGVTTQRIDQLVKAGRLHPWRDAEGVRHFDRTELTEYARARKRVGPHVVKVSNGRLAAFVFMMLDEGAGLRAIVRETLLPPEEVRRLYHEWNRPLTADDSERLERKAERAEERNHEFWLELFRARAAEADAEGRRPKKGNGSK